MKVHIVADIPDALAKEWLQHLRNFDTAHPSCHFSIVADASHMTVAEIQKTINITPKLDTITTKRKHT